jgi:hypothetical protein
LPDLERMSDGYGVPPALLAKRRRQTRALTGPF